MVQPKGGEPQQRPKPGKDSLQERLREGTDEQAGGGGLLLPLGFLLTLTPLHGRLLFPLAVNLNPTCPTRLNSNPTYIHPSLTTSAGGLSSAKTFAYDSFGNSQPAALAHQHRYSTLHPDLEGMATAPLLPVPRWSQLQPLSLPRSWHEAEITFMLFMENQISCPKTHLKRPGMPPPLALGVLFGAREGARSGSPLPLAPTRSSPLSPDPFSPLCWSPLLRTRIH